MSNRIYPPRMCSTSREQSIYLSTQNLDTLTQRSMSHTSDICGLCGTPYVKADSTASVQSEYAAGFLLIAGQNEGSQ